MKSTDAFFYIHGRNLTPLWPEISQSLEKIPVFCGWQTSRMFFLKLTGRDLRES